METVTKHFTVVEGDTFEAVVSIRDKATELPIDLSAATVRMQVRTAYNAVDPPALEFTSSDGLTVDGVNGTVTLSKITDIAAGEYVYDLQATFSGPVVRTYLRGRFRVLEGVTT